MEKSVKWPLQNPAFLILDVQKEYLRAHPEFRRIFPRIYELAVECRATGIPVIHTLTLHSRDRSSFTAVDAKFKRIHCIEGTECAEEVDLLANPRDVYVHKHMWSAFYQTRLDEILKSKKIDTLILSGLLTHCCVYATAIDAVQRHYKVIFAKDAIDSYRKGLHKTLMQGFFKNSVGEVTTTTDIIKRIKALQ